MYICMCIWLLFTYMHIAQWNRGNYIATHCSCTVRTISNPINIHRVTWIVVISVIVIDPLKPI